MMPVTDTAYTLSSGLITEPCNSKFHSVQHVVLVDIGAHGRPSSCLEFWQKGLQAEQGLLKVAIAAFFGIETRSGSDHRAYEGSLKCQHPSIA